MSTQEQGHAAVQAYLARNFIGFVECKKKIFEGLNIGCISLTAEIMRHLIKCVSIYYPEYLDGQTTLEQLKKYLKKEIRFVLLTKTKIYRSADAKDPKIKNHVEYLFKQICPIFIPFEDRRELSNIIKKALMLSEEKKADVKIIFININHYLGLLRMVYKNPAELRKHLEKLFSGFTAETMIKYLILPEKDIINNAQSTDNLSDEQRERANKSPVIQDQMRKIQTTLEAHINSIIQEVYPPA